jgi:hypothetical protein
VWEKYFEYAKDNFKITYYRFEDKAIARVIETDTTKTVFLSIGKYNMAFMEHELIKALDDFGIPQLPFGAS